MLDDHRAISVGYPGEQVSDGPIGLFIDFVLGFWDRFNHSERSCSGYHGLAHDFTGFVNYDFSEMVTGSIHMLGDFRIFFF
jgi:hypothetical protein